MSFDMTGDYDAVVHGQSSRVELCFAFGKYITVFQRYLKRKANYLARKGARTMEKILVKEFDDEWRAASDVRQAGTHRVLLQSAPSPF
ncbi:hypothetical protein JTB14_022040 [Gonioctena quinquepunctata]|nr:hypothetical protein JTB14_022040 [Gonioctena quinquepunctata]